MSAPELREILMSLGVVNDADNRVPRHFGDPAAEYSAASESVGLADLSHRGRLEITGKDRIRFVNNLCTNDVAKAADGTGCEAFFLDAKGRVIDYATLFILGDSLWLDLDPDRIGPFVKHLDRYIIREDVQLNDRSEETALLHVVGPRAAEVLARVNIVLGAHFQHSAAVIGGVPCHAFRRDRSIHLGCDIVVPAAEVGIVWQVLWDAGQIAGVRAVGMEALEVLRVEAGIPAMGKEVTEAHFPQEFARDSIAISFNKGCYIGQETVARIDAYGHVNRLLRGLTWSGPAESLIGNKVFLDDKEMGVLTSAVASPHFGRAIGLAVLRAGGNEPGKQVVVGTSSEKIAATVVSLPFESSAPA